MLSDLYRAIILAFVLSFILATIEVKRESKADLLPCMSGLFFFFYFFILAFGNSLTTLIASTFLAEYLPKEGLGISNSANSANLPNLTLYGPPWIWYAFFGVFGFQGILKNMNVTMFDKGVLTINDWIRKALDLTVADAIESQAKKNTVEFQKLASNLRDKLNEEDLNTYAIHAIGHDEVDELKQKMAQGEGDIKLALALAIVNHDVDNAIAIVKASAAKP